MTATRWRNRSDSPFIERSLESRTPGVLLAGACASGACTVWSVWLYLILEYKMWFAWLRVPERAMVLAYHAALLNQVRDPAASGAGAKFEMNCAVCSSPPSRW